MHGGHLNILLMALGDDFVLCCPAVFTVLSLEATCFVWLPKFAGICPCGVTGI